MPCTISGVAAKLPANTGEDVAYEFPEAQRRYVAERPPRLFPHHKTQAAEAPEGRAHGGMDDYQRRGMGPDTDHAAHGAPAARRWLADARHPQLVLARIRQSCRLLAAFAGL